ncbi:oxaloacetate decarboxylase subunit gamma [Idiomarina sp. X4]|uniref:OadG family transporter subunit n=1 Tax=unclassified Idiomarina TaxID=2614829 RepID=UPI000C293C8A|nr:MULTISPECIES: OadG family transporter subunit [unclassified Idiomarina]ATZ73978.1 oxaloacetate decarboxylase subunit gamma [Idiomarina sp. X4]RXS42025.1 oxaloacetate decarboxylase subunit gamma [Idiomarina sp. 29L]
MQELLTQAAQLMLVGMGAVIVFLCILVVCMAVMKWLIPTPSLAPQTPNQPRSDASAGKSPTLVAAVSAAVHQYRQRHSAAENKEMSK